MITFLYAANLALLVLLPFAYMAVFLDWRERAAAQGFR